MSSINKDISKQNKFLSLSTTISPIENFYLVIFLEIKDFICLLKETSLFLDN